jgi:hypothetical protein
MEQKQAVPQAPLEVGSARGSAGKRQSTQGRGRGCVAKFCYVQHRVPEMRNMSVGLDLNAGAQWERSKAGGVIDQQLFWQVSLQGELTRWVPHISTKSGTPPSLRRRFQM